VVSKKTVVNCCSDIFSLSDAPQNSVQPLNANTYIQGGA